MHFFKFLGIGKIISGLLTTAFFLIFLKSAKVKFGIKNKNKKTIRILLNIFNF